VDNSVLFKDLFVVFVWNQTKNPYFFLGKRTFSQTIQFQSKIIPNLSK